MNCKKGDLAIVVSSLAGNEGRIVRCLEFIGMMFWLHGEELRRNATWRIDVELPPFDGKHNDMIEDYKLRPLRDNDGEDEMLRIAGKPQDIKQPA